MGVWSWHERADITPPKNAATSESQRQRKSSTPSEPETLRTRQIRWLIINSPTTTANELRDCLADAGLRDASAISSQGAPIVVTRAGLNAPQIVRTLKKTTQITTPISSDIYRSVALHIATTQCLYADDASVVDEALNRRLKGSHWPRLSEAGRISVLDLVRIDAENESWRTRGLDRLGKPEIVYRGGTDQDSEVVLERIAATFAVAPGSETGLSVAGVGVVRLIALENDTDLGHSRYRLAQVTKPLQKDMPPPSTRAAVPAQLPRKERITVPVSARKRRPIKRAGRKGSQNNKTKSKPIFRPDYR